MKNFSLLNISLAIVSALLIISDPKIVHQTMIVKCLAFIGAVVFGYIGAFIGEFLRNIAMPDSIIIRGGMKDILLSKLFWAAGPHDPTPKNETFTFAMISIKILFVIQ